jgi:hypothetical protein
MSSSSSSSSEDEQDPVSDLLLNDELSEATLAALREHMASKADDETEAAEEADGAGVAANFGLSQFWVRVDPAREYRLFGQHARACTYTVHESVRDKLTVVPVSMTMRRPSYSPRKRWSRAVVARSPS